MKMSQTAACAEIAGENRDSVGDGGDGGSGYTQYGYRVSGR